MNQHLAQAPYQTQNGAEGKSHVLLALTKNETGISKPYKRNIKHIMVQQEISYLKSSIYEHEIDSRNENKLLQCHTANVEYSVVLTIGYIVYLHQPYDTR